MGVLMRAPFTQERLKELLHYDPETGIFTWLVMNSRRIKVGSVAGCISVTKRKNMSDHPRIMIGVDGHRILAHRLAWLYMTGEWPKEQIDHKNLNSTDNKWSNLREATNAQNAANNKKRATNTSGFKGVHLNKFGKYEAYITINYKKTHLGNHSTAEAAYAAYCEAARELHGEFARTE